MATPQRRRQQNPRGQGERLRRDLIEAAASMLERGGHAKSVTLRAVAREIGIAAPSIYRHFPDRDALVAAVVEQRASDLHAAMQTAMNATSGPMQRLRAACLTYCRFGIDHPGHYRLLFDTTWALRAGQDGSGAQIFTLLHTAIDDWVEASLTRESDSFTLGASLWATLHGLVTLRTTKPDFGWPSVEDMIDTALASHVELR